jgi:hypothetical protein
VDYDLVSKAAVFPNAVDRTLEVREVVPRRNQNGKGGGEIQINFMVAKIHEEWFKTVIIDQNNEAQK